MSLIPLSEKSAYLAIKLDLYLYIVGKRNFESITSPLNPAPDLSLPVTPIQAYPHPFRKHISSLPGRCFGASVTHQPFHSRYLGRIPVPTVKTISARLGVFY